jgi:hypothetical protein
MSKTKGPSSPEDPNKTVPPWLHGLQKFLQSDPAPQHITTALVPSGRANPNTGAPELFVVICQRRALGNDWTYQSFELPTLLSMIAACIGNGQIIGVEQAPTPVGLVQ